MGSIPPIICLSSNIKCSHNFITEIQSTDSITLVIIFFPTSLFKFMIEVLAFDSIFLFTLLKNNSIGANSGEYCGKYIQVNPFSFRYDRVCFEQCTAELSMISHILFLSISIVVLTQLANVLYTQWIQPRLLFLLWYLKC